MIKTVLIDDEKNALEVLDLQLKNYCPSVQVVELASGGQQGIEAIQRHQPDLVFLDIEMPHKNGFDVLNETVALNYNVVFTTAYDSFAIRAFRHSAVDYLLKPVDISELQQAVDKASKNIGIHLQHQVQILMQQLQEKKQNYKIALPIGDSLQFFNADEIIQCESDSNYTHIILKGGRKITVSKTLKEVEAVMEGLNFSRIHQSHLVNMSYIERYVRGDPGYVVLTDGSRLAVSRNKKDDFFSQFRRV